MTLHNFRRLYSNAYRQSGSCHGACPSATQLADLAADRLWRWQRRPLLQHLATCSDCADDYRVMHAAYLGMKSALPSGSDHRSNSLLGSYARLWQPSGLRPAMLTAMVAVLMVFGGAFVYETLHHSAAPMDSRSHGQSVQSADLQDDVLTGGGFESAPQMAANDVLFRNDFDQPAVSGAQPVLHRQEVFADSFGG